MRKSRDMCVADSVTTAHLIERIETLSRAPVRVDVEDLLNPYEDLPPWEVDTRLDFVLNELGCYREKTMGALKRAVKRRGQVASGLGVLFFFVGTFIAPLIYIAAFSNGPNFLLAAIAVAISILVAKVTPVMHEETVRSVQLRRELASWTEVFVDLQLHREPGMPRKRRRTSKFPERLRLPSAA